nr:sugar transporter SWEET1 isoform X2 [Peromyscus maniculatus bairdii]
MEAGGVADSVLSGACVLFTLGMFSTGLSDLRHMQRTRSVDSIQFLPFLTTDVNNLGWLSYGVLKGDGTLIIVNAVGAVLQTLYILAYLHYSPQKCCVNETSFKPLVKERETAVKAGIKADFPIRAWTKTGCSNPRREMSVLAKIIQTKSTQRLSFSLTIATLLSSTSWSIYGFRLRDPYITVPNLPGILTSLIRLGLFCKYPPEHDRKYHRLLQT